MVGVPKQAFLPVHCNLFFTCPNLREEKDQIWRFWLGGTQLASCGSYSDRSFTSKRCFPHARRLYDHVRIG